MGIKWTDVEDLGILLYEADPDQDPLQVRFTELRDLVQSLDDFEDDPARVNEKVLEAIQMAWNEEFQDA